VRFQLAREIRAMGIDCDIIAVTSIPRSTEDKRPEDDRRDAQSLLEAVTAPSCKCRAVYIPSGESEATRDLCRAYYDMVLATKRLKMQFSAIVSA
jgi:transposase